MAHGSQLLCQQFPIEVIEIPHADALDFDRNIIVYGVVISPLPGSQDIDFILGERVEAMSHANPSP
jgi:hypothetical protein